MNRSAAVALCLVTASTAALGDPREATVFQNVPSNGRLNSPANAVRNHSFAGGYALGRIDLVGTLTSVHPQTWRTDSRIVITAPGGAAATFQPFTTGGTFSTLPFSASMFLPTGTNPAGQWTMRFYESFDDGGTALVDATWNLTVTLTDDPPAPPQATDLGSLAAPGLPPQTQPLGAGQVRWYRFTLLTDVSAGLQRYLDLDTGGSSLPLGVPADDTAMGLYNSTGVLIAFDDDSCEGFTSQLSFGSGTRPPRGDGVPFDGRNGPLQAGTYYLAVGAYPMTFGAVHWDARADLGPVGEITISIATNLGALCYANCDGSTVAPVLNVSDFICFQTRFAAGDPYANCDGSTIPPVLNINDFICFQQKFAAGCP